MGREFRPFILYHESSSRFDPVQQQQPVKLEEYKDRVKKMMERNAKFWVQSDDDQDINVSPSTSTTSSSSASSCDSLETIDKGQEQHVDPLVIGSYPSWPDHSTLHHPHHAHPHHAGEAALASALKPMHTPPSPPSPPIPSPATAAAASVAAAPPSAATTATTATSPTQKKRRRGNLPKEVTEFLKQWLVQHKKHPYPSEKEKLDLAHRTGLTVNQISNWFINARRRILQPMLESEGLQAHLLSYSNQPHHHHQHQHSHPHQQQQLQNTSSMDQRRQRQMDIYSYQNLTEPFEDTGRWAFRRTRLPNIDDRYSVAIR
ncbi:hypothetical protein BC940DRAFT_293612 [Gongronella butleri]|nr:hypothetical protein BC940DRAFT_293612 [Gongronella butleri]